MRLSIVASLACLHCSYAVKVADGLNDPFFSSHFGQPGNATFDYVGRDLHGFAYIFIFLANFFVSDWWWYCGPNHRFTPVCRLGRLTSAQDLTCGHDRAVHHSVAVIEAGGFYQIQNGNGSIIPAMAALQAAGMKQVSVNLN